MKPVKSGRFVSQLTKSTMAVIMAGGRGERLSHLTRHRAKPAVTFGGKYRIIDFTLSNCVNSGIRQILVLTQYKAHTLIQHVQRGWGYLRGELGEFVQLVPAQQQHGDRWYMGTADAVFQNLDIIEAYHPDMVLVLAGDHVYKMDYGPMIAFHVENNADITVGVVQVPVAEATQYGVMTVDEDQRVIAFSEKPANPEPMPGSEDIALASMGIYVFNREYLAQRLEADAADPASQHDFGKNILPRTIHEGRVFAYAFQDVATSAQAYWRDVGTVDAFYDANMELTHVTPELNLYDDSWPVWTYQEQAPAAKFVLDEAGRRGVAINSLVSGGCIISGARVQESLLSFSVRIEEGTELYRTVVLPQVTIGRNCKIRNAIIDSDCDVPDGTIIGYDLEADRKRFHVTERGVVLVTPDLLHDAPPADDKLSETARQRALRGSLFT
ncbi:MAG: glucose-1-phosphate adenylyltransferase [Gammaproteobacteria bacterium]|nr:glucose-1-phosphate adenylyltransferase [Gammaproteobacteria bacterium]